MKIVGICKPFNPSFEFIVYDETDDSMQATFNAKFDDISQLAINIAKQYGNKIQLMGPKNYTERIGKEIQEKAKREYDSLDIEIEYI